MKPKTKKRLKRILSLIFAFILLFANVDLSFALPIEEQVVENNTRLNDEKIVGENRTTKDKAYSEYNLKFYTKKQEKTS